MRAAVLSLEEIVGRFVVEAEQQRLQAHANHVGDNDPAVEAAEETCREVLRAVRQMVAADRAQHLPHGA